MKLSTGFTVAAIPAFTAGALVPTGAIPLWFRIALISAGGVLLFLSFVSESNE